MAKKKIMRIIQANLVTRLARGDAGRNAGQDEDAGADHRADPDERHVKDAHLATELNLGGKLAHGVLDSP
jgi:hypothetical protein